MCGQFVETDSDRLAEVHGRLARVGWDFDQNVAVGKIVSGEAVLFRTEDEGGTAAFCQFTLHKRREVREGDDWLLGLATGERAGSGDEGALCDTFGQGSRLARAFQL